MYKYKIHKKTKWWNPETTEEEERAYCREKNPKLLSEKWSNVKCKACLNLYKILNSGFLPKEKWL